MTKIPVNENWWRTIFDEVYLKTDARSVCNDGLTRKEVDFLHDGLGIAENAQILDLCGGQGRHALEMARRGFTHITVLDYSMFLLSCGIEKAAEEGLPVAFVRGDARHVGLQDHSFHFILLMGSSFGYCLNENDNLKILTEAYRLLTTKGLLLLDLPDKNHVIKNFKPYAHHRADDQIEVIRERKLEKNVIYCREKVMTAAGDCIRENTFCTRLYSREKIQEMLHTAGFTDVLFKADFMYRGNSGDFGCMTNRMIVMAGKAD